MKTIHPESLGFLSSRLERISAVMQRYVDEGKIAGILTLLARGSDVAYLHTCGFADIEAQLPMRPDTIFRIYSMTKPVTSAAVLLLMEEGVLRLDDSLARYYPAFGRVKVLDTAPHAGGRLTAPQRLISLRDLLTHTAGLGYGFDQDVLLDDLYRRDFWSVVDGNPGIDLDEKMRLLAGLPLYSHPGVTFRYSLATDVLGAVVQKAADMPFGDFLRRRIFDPLGMPDTGFCVPQEKLERFSVIYGPSENGALKVEDARLGSEFTRLPAGPSGGGGLVSTAGDYLRFCQMLLNRGELDGVRLLGRKTVELMTCNHLPPNVHPFDDLSSGFGLGVSVRLEPGKSSTPGSVGMYGWSGAANTNFWIDPAENLVGMALLQYMPMDTHPVVADFRALAYQAMI